MTNSVVVRLIRTRLMARWAVQGALIAALPSGWLVLLVHFSRPAVLASSLAILSGAAAGAALAVLYQAAGRIRFWAIVLGLCLAGLAIGAIFAVRSGLGQPLLWLWLLVLPIALSLWVLLAYGASVLIKRLKITTKR